MIILLILNKAGILNATEMDIMKTHVVKGYPNHLAGKEIGIYGRIIAMADIFDTLEQFLKIRDI